MANYSVAVTTLSMNGLCHEKTAEFCGGALLCGGSRASYRNKLSTTRRLEPEYRTTRRDILDEPCLQCDAMWWKLLKSNNGKIMAARGRHLCLMVVWSAAMGGGQKDAVGIQGMMGLFEHLVRSTSGYGQRASPTSIQKNQRRTVACARLPPV